MRRSLTKYAWLSVGAAALTFSIKLAAAYLSGSVGLLSDALEAVVNLAAASIALIILKIVEQPPDESHPYGHDKAEYFSSGIESTLIIIASLSILYTGIRGLLDPEPLEQVGLGLALATGASVINLLVGQIMIRAGKKNDSITLEANGRHLMTDVWTSVGVVVGVTLAVVTGLQWLDPLIAIVVGLHIGWEGVKIFRRSVGGLMDSPISGEERRVVEAILNKSGADGVKWHALRTRQSGARRFIDVHVLVPGAWTVQESHDLAESFEAEIREKIHFSTVMVHMEPLEDERSWQDQALNGRNV
jgi:cation diffusion facilitator family transporter